jgi:transcriptional regulator with XRE-family HTH domain
MKQGGDRMKNNRMASLRKERGLTQEAAAKMLGIARSTFANYENGIREPDNETLKHIADFYEVSIDYLLGREEKSEYKTKGKTNEIIIKEIVNKYNVDLSVPGTKEKLEQIIQLVLGDSKSQK